MKIKLSEEIVMIAIRTALKNHDEEVRDGSLKSFIAARWTEESPINEITERLIQQCVEERCKREVIGEQLYLGDQADTNLVMNTYTVKVKD